MHQDRTASDTEYDNNWFESPGSSCLEADDFILRRLRHQCPTSACLAGDGKGLARDVELTLAPLGEQFLDSSNGGGCEIRLARALLHDLLAYVLVIGEVER